MVNAINTLVRHIILSSKEVSKNNKGEDQPRFERSHGGSQIIGVSDKPNANEDCRAFLVDLAERNLWNIVEYDQLPEGVFFDPTTLPFVEHELSAPCIYTEADLPEEFEAYENFRYWKDLSDEEKDRCVIESGHELNGCQVFLDGMKPRRVQKVRMIIGTGYNRFGDVKSSPMVWTWFPGSWSIHIVQNLTEDFNKDDLHPYTVVKGR